MALWHKAGCVESLLWLTQRDWTAPKFSTLSRRK